jgi:primosomal replication protein N
MLQTITIGSYISVQGLLVRHLPDGKMVVRVDNKNFVGVPVTARQKSEAVTA